MATFTAATLNFSDVNAAYAFCSDGDTLSIPGGDVVWSSSTLNVTKGITIQGPGYSTCKITESVLTSDIIDINLGSDKACRVTGIGLVSGRYGIYIGGSLNGSFALTKLRIDNCYFNQPSVSPQEIGIRPVGWIEGCIDHNYFDNCNVGIYVVGDSDQAWSSTRLAWGAGTSHALFIEDNIFVEGATFNGNESIYHQDGGRTVIRYNTFDQSALSSPTNIIDSHGCQPYYLGPGSVDGRAQPLVEIYQNTFLIQTAYRIMYLRGGSFLVHDNTITASGAVSGIISLTCEQYWYSVVWIPNRTVWPGQDQIHDSFFWNNKVNGVSMNPGLANANDSIELQLGRDYFNTAPAASGGKTVYGGTRNGGSANYPTDGTVTFGSHGSFPGGTYLDPGTTSFNASGPNAYYPYSTYQYPHPLQGTIVLAPLEWRFT